jgi:hypothetical protein
MRVRVRIKENKTKEHIRSDLFTPPGYLQSKRSLARLRAARSFSGGAPTIHTDSIAISCLSVRSNF